MRTVYTLTARASLLGYGGASAALVGAIKGVGGPLSAIDPVRWATRWASALMGAMYR